MAFLKVTNVSATERCTKDQWGGSVHVEKIVKIRHALTPAATLFLKKPISLIVWQKLQIVEVCL